MFQSLARRVGPRAVHGRVAASTAIALVLALAPHSPVAAADPELDWDPARSEERARSLEPRSDDGAGGPVVQAFPGAAGRVAYSRAPFSLALDATARIYTMEAGGSDQRGETSTTRGLGDDFAAWSPGGTLIAFTRDTTASTTDDAGDLYVMDADGSNLRQLTSGTPADYSPAWSPDGSQIAFASNRNGPFNIYILDLDEGVIRRLTSSSVGDFDPAWSPDGTKIAFVSFRDGNAEIYTINATGGGLQRLTNSGALDLTPAWNPNGTQIAFSSDRGAGPYLDIFTMSSSGSGVEVYSVEVGPDGNQFNPAWHPAFEGMVFTTDAFGDFDILYQLGAGNSGELWTTSTEDEFNPDWQPLPEFPLVDARFSSFEEHIVWVYENGIASGCTAERYCPRSAVTRGQMASFLSRALDLPPTDEDFFTDDETSTHEIAINRVAAAGIASGCSEATYCPNAVVTREQMASFLSRALDLPPTDEDFFTDDETSTHEIAINRVAAAGIASGCAESVTGTSYCPKAVVTRGQMAAFLHRALEAEPA